MSNLYWIIEPLDGNTSSYRSNKINRELWDIEDKKWTRPLGRVTSKTFNEITLTDGRVAIEFPSDYKVRVRDSGAASILVSNFSDLKNNEKNSIVSAISSNSEVLFSTIIPINASIHTREELVSLGLLNDINYTQ